jgi:hypothetical protein
MATSADLAACKPWIRRKLDTSRRILSEYAYLDTRDTDTDMCSLNHTNIVSAITDSEQDCFLILLDQLYYESLLQGGDTTCNTWGLRVSA